MCEATIVQSYIIGSGKTVNHRIHSYEKTDYCLGLLSFILIVIKIT